MAVVLGWRFVLGRMRDVGLSLGVFLESGDWIKLDWDRILGIGSRVWGLDLVFCALNLVSLCGTYLPTT